MSANARASGDTRVVACTPNGEARSSKLVQYWRRTQASVSEAHGLPRRGGQRHSQFWAPGCGAAWICATLVRAANSKWPVPRGANACTMTEAGRSRAMPNAIRLPSPWSLAATNTSAVISEFIYCIPTRPRAPDAPRDQSLAISGQLLRLVENSCRTRPFAAPDRGQFGRSAFRRAMATSTSRKAASVRSICCCARAFSSASLASR